MIKRRSIILFMFFVMPWVAAVANRNEILARVITVIDGNTVEVASTGNQKHKVVLVGIDCPELGQAFGDKAKLFLERILLQKNVTVQVKGKDKYGNYLGVILVGDDDPRVELLKEGLAWTEEKNSSPDLQPYLTFAQKKAKGLWKQSNPTPPWTFRRQQSMSKPKSS